MYEEVDEKEYSRLVQKRQEEDWIIDDGNMQSVHLCARLSHLLLLTMPCLENAQFILIPWIKPILTECVYVAFPAFVLDSAVLFLQHWLY